jgi:hypothetical protein
MPDLIGHPGFLDSRFRGNDTHGDVIEFAKTFEKRYTLGFVFSGVLGVL